MPIEARRRRSARRHARAHRETDLRAEAAGRARVSAVGVADGCDAPTAGYGATKASQGPLTMPTDPARPVFVCG